MRVRSFTQDDAHIFCTEEQMAEECHKINELILSVYGHFGFDKIVVKLSTRPEKRVGTDAMWDHAEAVMTRVLDEIRMRHGNIVTTALNPGEGAFYGPKFEYVLRDAIGRDWQCGTTQVDFNLPERFGAFYIAGNSEKTTPVMIHRAICGSMERFIGILLEHHAGHLPLWLAPVQIVVCTITSDADDAALRVRRRGEEAGPEVETDLRNEKINYKVREHSLAKVPVLLALGRKEASENTVSLRRLGSNAQTAMGAEEALEALASEAMPPDLRGCLRGWGVRKPSIPENVAAHKFTPENDFNSLTATLRNSVTAQAFPSLVLRSAEGPSRRTFQRAPTGAAFWITLPNSLCERLRMRPVDIGPASRSAPLGSLRQLLSRVRALKVRARFVVISEKQYIRRQPARQEIVYFS